MTPEQRITRKQRDANLRQEAEEQKKLVEVRASIAAGDRALCALEAQGDFMRFVKFTSPDPAAPGDLSRSRYQNAKHHDAVAKILELLAKGDLKFEDDRVATQLILCMPPRHGKSELTTRKFPAWYVGRNPLDNVAVSSYSDTMAQDFGRDVRGNIQLAQFKQVFPSVKLMPGSAASDRLQVESKGQRGGTLVFVGRGGALTGRGAHLLILDDLLKDASEARSQVVRDQTWDWFTRVAMTRRMGRKIVVLIMTRWHSDDPVGRLTDPENPFFNPFEAKEWKIINLPAIAEEDDPLGREAGEALWPDGPDKFDLRFLASQQRLDPLGFAALYQQRPSAADGTLFKREYVQFYDELPDDLRMYASSDHAVSLAARRDFTVLLIAGIDRQNNLYIVDCFWERAAADRVVEMMLQMGGERNPLVWWAERGHISKALGPFLRKRMQEEGIFFHVVEVVPAGDKEQRAQSFSGRMAQGRVFLPRNAPWTEKAVNELMAFPNGTHDDFVDACSLLGLGLRAQFAPTAAPKKSEPRYGTLGWIKQDAERMKKHLAKASGGGW